MRVSDLIDELARRYPAFRPETWRPRFEAVLGAHEGSELQAAWDATDARWKKASHPRPADIEANLAHPGGKKPQITNTMREDWAARVMAMDVGQEALRGGYAREMWCWATRYHEAIPGPVSVIEFRAATKRTEAWIDAALAAPNPPPGLKIAERMMSFERQLRERYLGGGETDRAVADEPYGGL